MRLFFLTISIIFLSIRVVWAYEYNANLSLTLSEEYDNNIFLESSNRKSDFITYISPGLNFEIRSLNSRLSLGYVPTITYYHSYSDLNETAHSFTADYNLELSERINIDMTGRFIKSTETGDFIEIPDIGPIITRTEREYQRLDGKFSYKARENIEYSLAIMYSDINYKEQEMNDVKTYSGNVGFLYRMGGNNSFTINVIHNEYDYRQRSDASNQRFILGTTYSLYPTVTISLSGGPSYTRYRDTNESHTGIDGSIALTKRFKTGNALLAFRQSVIAGIDSGEPSRERTLSFRLLKNLTDQLGTSLVASFSNYKSEGTNNENRDFIRLGADMTYRLKTWLNFILSYRYANVNDKKDNRNDYYDHVISVSLESNYNTKL